MDSGSGAVTVGYQPEEDEPKMTSIEEWEKFLENPFDEEREKQLLLGKQPSTIKKPDQTSVQRDPKAPPSAPRLKFISKNWYACLYKNCCCVFPNHSALLCHMTGSDTAHAWFFKLYNTRAKTLKRGGAWPIRAPENRDKVLKMFAGKGVEEKSAGGKISHGMLRDMLAGSSPLVVGETYDQCPHYKPDTLFDVCAQG